PCKCWPTGHEHMLVPGEYEPPVGMQMPGCGLGFTQPLGTLDWVGMSLHGPEVAAGTTATVALFQPVEPPSLSKQSIWNVVVAVSGLVTVLAGNEVYHAPVPNCPPFNWQPLKLVPLVPLQVSVVGPLPYTG